MIRRGLQSSILMANSCGAKTAKKLLNGLRYSASIARLPVTMAYKLLLYLLFFNPKDCILQRVLLTSVLTSKSVLNGFVILVNHR
jgi:hypothetical protein